MTHIRDEPAQEEPPVPEMAATSEESVSPDAADLEPSNGHSPANEDGEANEDGGDGERAEGEPQAPEPEASEQATSGDETPEADAPATRRTPRVGAGEELTDEELDAQIAALVFASPEALTTARLTSLLERPRAARVTESLERLGERLEAGPLPLRLRAIAGGWRLMTAPDMAEVIGRLSKNRKIERISPAALETLSIVAYRQPVTKAEIEAIRGVQAGAILRSLVERGLARITGRADQPGAPLQYGTTREFLDRFGLESLQDLPRDGELMRD